MKCHILVIPKTTLATSNITCNHIATCTMARSHQ